MSIFVEWPLTFCNIVCKYYLLCVISHLGYPDLVEVDMLHLSRSIFWPKWSFHGVSPKIANLLTIL